MALEDHLRNPIATAENGAMVFLIKSSAEFVDDALARNTHNRRLQSQAAGRLAEQMKVGQWMFVGDPIRFNEDGIVLDGQHRLVANKAAGYPPVEFLVVYGLPMATQLVVDRQAKRSIADCLTLALRSSVSSRFVSALNFLYRVGTSVPFAYANKAATEHELAEMFFDWKEDFEAVEASVRSSSKCMPAPFAAAFMQYMSAWPEKSKDAIGRYSRMAGVSEEDPMFKLRRWYEDTSSTYKMGGGASGQMARYRKAVAACCMDAAGVGVKSLVGHTSWDRMPRALGDIIVPMETRCDISCKGAIAEKIRAEVRNAARGEKKERVANNASNHR